MYGYIYLILNKVNGKTYIGQRKSKNWKDSYMGSGQWLKSAKLKYGIENFEKFLIQYVETPEEANKAEIFWIEYYRKLGKAEYNIADGGVGISPMKGKHHSEESNRRNAEAHKGKKLWPNGRSFTEEHCKHISDGKKGQASFTGKHHTEETKRKISEKNKGRPSPNKGKPNTWTCKNADKYRVYKQNGGELSWNEFQKIAHQF